MTAVTHPHWLWIGGQGQLIAGARVAEDVATVAAVVLEDRKKAVTCTLTLLTVSLPGSALIPEWRHVAGFWGQWQRLLALQMAVSDGQTPS